MNETRCDRTVLVVEDDPDVREALCDALEACEYRPVAAANGREALECLRESATQPCVILLDIMMPVMDGRQFRAVQRLDAALASIPVVVLSAHVNAGETASEMEAASYLRKPVPLQTLLSTVERYCAAAPPVC